MEFYAQLKSKKELEADFPRLVSVFLDLAEELIAAEEEEKQVSEAKEQSLSNEKQEQD